MAIEYNTIPLSQLAQAIGTTSTPMAPSGGVFHSNYPQFGGQGGGHAYPVGGHGGGSTTYKTVYMGPLDPEALAALGADGWILSCIWEGSAYFHRTVP